MNNNSSDNGPPPRPVFRHRRRKREREEQEEEDSNAKRQRCDDDAPTNIGTPTATAAATPPAQAKNDAHVFQQQQQQQQHQSHTPFQELPQRQPPLLLQPPPQPPHNNSNLRCSICWEVPKSAQHTAVLPCCDHEFCWGCIVTWGQRHENTCPLCKRRFATLQRKQAILPTTIEAQQKVPSLEATARRNENDDDDDDFARDEQGSGMSNEETNDNSTDTDTTAPVVNQLNIETRYQQPSSWFPAVSAALMTHILGQVTRRVHEEAYQQILQQQEQHDRYSAQELAWIHNFIWSELRTETWMERISSELFPPEMLVEVGLARIQNNDDVGGVDVVMETETAEPTTREGGEAAVLFAQASPSSLTALEISALRRTIFDSWESLLQRVDQEAEDVVRNHGPSRVELTFCGEILSAIVSAMALVWYLWMAARVLPSTYYHIAHWCVWVTVFVQLVFGGSFTILSLLWKPENFRLRSFLVQNTALFLVLIVLSQTEPGENGGPWRFAFEASNNNVTTSLSNGTGSIVA